MSEIKAEAKEKKTADRRPRKTKDALRKAFFELLSEKPPKKITVTEVARRADLDRKTFYLHYGSIEDLIDDILHEEVKIMSAHLGESTVNDAGEVDVSSLFRSLAIELAPNLEEGKAIASHLDLETVIDHLEPLLVRALIEKDSLGLADKLGPYLDFIVTFYCAGALATFHRWVESDSEIPMDKLAALAGIAVSGALNALLANVSQMRQ